MNNLLDEIKETKELFQDQWQKGSWKTKVRICLVLALWPVSIVFATLTLVEVIEICDFISMTGFIPSTIENAVISVGAYSLQGFIAKKEF